MYGTAWKEDDTARCDTIADALRQATRVGGFLGEEVCAPVDGHYGRRLLHQDPAGRYTVIAMIWGEGQGTPLHDHAGIWCVECVYQGQVEVVSYDRVADKDSVNRVFDFRRAESVVTGVGTAGALIPPYEYHTIENAGGGTAVTIHVYGGEMEVCNIFEPLEAGGYRKVDRELSYDA